MYDSLGIIILRHNSKCHTVIALRKHFFISYGGKNIKDGVLLSHLTSKNRLIVYKSMQEPSLTNRTWW